MDESLKSFELENELDDKYCFDKSGGLSLDHNSNSINETNTWNFQL